MRDLMRKDHGIEAHPGHRGEEKGRHGHDGHGFHDGRGPEEKGRRIFGHGEMRFVLLAQLAENPAHGYELIKAISERLNGAYAPSPGLIYPTLTLLEELGYVVAQATEEGKRAYAITEQGREFLRVSKAKVEQIQERMVCVAERQRRSTAPEIGAAMEELKAALRQKSWEAELTQPQIEAIAGLVKQAAGAIGKI